MHLLRALLAASAILASGCNFIFNPDGDGIIRCDNADDCDGPLVEALSDNRGQSSCAAAGGGGGGFTDSQDNKVCSVVDKDDVTCNPNVMGDTLPRYVETFNSASEQIGLYIACPGAMRGTAGCEVTASGGCDSGLTPRTVTVITDEMGNQSEELTICDDGKGLHPAVEPSGALKGQDVLDQHCRSYFCDADFVCSRAAGFKCERCDPELPFGSGGCGDLYLQGKASTVYQTRDQLSDGCAGEASAESTEFGPIVEATP